MKPKTGTTAEEHRCQNPKCRRPLMNRRKDTKYCDNTCRYAVTAAAARENADDQPDVWICSGCRYPKQQQAEIVPGDRAVRHPFSGARPEWSGYCVVKSCECATCRPENSPALDA